MRVRNEYDGQPPIQTAIKQVSDSPESQVYAKAGTIVTTADGDLYFKRTDENKNTGWFLRRPVIVVETAAALKAVTGYKDKDVAIVLGHTEIWDGDGGIYVFDKTNQNDTEITYYKPNDISFGPGRWVAVTYQYLS